MLLKKLYGYLIAADCDNRALRELGWADLFLGDGASATDARIVGAMAVHHLLLDADGRQISHDDRIIYGVLAFVQAERRSGQLPSGISQGLAVVLHKPPVALEAITAWFLATFP